MHVTSPRRTEVPCWLDLSIQTLRINSAKQVLTWELKVAWLWVMSQWGLLGLSS